MAFIPFVAKAGEEIVARIAAGDLEVVGLEVRDVVGKKIRYILRGAEHLPTDPLQLGNLPPLEPLRAVMSVAKLANIVGVAQNAMLARTLGRIESKLDQMSQRLDVSFRRLGGMDFKLDLLIADQKTKPMNLLRAAQNAATIARGAGDTGQLIAAAKDAEQAARDLLSFARSLAEIKRDNIPAVLVVPNELAWLVDAAAEAMAIAAAMQVALGHSPTAVRNLNHVASTISNMRTHLADCVIDPALAEYRIHMPLAPDDEVMNAAASLRHTQHWLQSRATCIALGLIGPGQGDALEATVPVEGLAFEVVEMEKA